MSSRAVIDVSHLPPSAVSTQGLLWWGNVFMLVIEGMVLALLVATYFYLRFWLPAWPPPGATFPALRWPTLNLLVLIVSALPMRMADKAAERGDRRGVQVGLVGGIVLGLAFLAGRIAIWRTFPFDYASHAYGSIVYTILGAHTMHVVAATAEAAVLLFFACQPDKFHDEQRLGVVTSGLYWNFVVGSWIVLYAVVYLGPRMLKA
jgi:heme/copper-type cytochrome/quinol oxidase subunit 3